MKKQIAFLHHFLLPTILPGFHLLSFTYYIPTPILICGIFFFHTKQLSNTIWVSYNSTQFQQFHHYFLRDSIGSQKIPPRPPPP